MELYLNMLFITIICVLIIDDSGIINSVKSWLGKFLEVDPGRLDLKPFSCSYCMNFWCCTVYLLCLGQLTIFNIMISLILSTCTVPIFNTINLIKDIYTK